MIMRLISMVLAVLLLGVFPVDALTRPNLDSPREEGPYILCAEYANPDLATWPYTKNIIVLESDTELKLSESNMAPSKMLPFQMTYMCENGATVNVDVIWDISDESLKQPGLHQVIGYPVVDGTSILLAEGYDGKVTWPVFRKGGEPLALISRQKPLVINSLLPLNGDTSGIDISIRKRKWGAGTDGIIISDDSWKQTLDVSEVDLSAPGTYTVTVVQELPEWLTANDEDRSSQHTVYVLPDDRIEIYAVVDTLVTHRNGEILGCELVIEWLYDSTNVTETILQRMDEDGLWVDCEKSWYEYSAPSKYVEGKLKLQLLEITAGVEHCLQLRYMDLVDGEPVERVTMPITLTVPENILEILESADGGIPVELNIGGDRDEDDFDDQGEEPPHGELIPPATTPPETLPDQEDTSSEDGSIEPPVYTPASTDSEPPSEVSETDFDDQSEEPPPTEIVTSSEPQTERSTDTEATTDPTEEPPEDPSADIDSADPSGDDSREQKTEPTEKSDTTEATVEHSSAESNRSHNDDESATEFTGEAESLRGFDIVILILGVFVLGGILCILFLYRKKEKK